MPKKTLNNLILFGIYSSGDKCGFDELVKECFTLFPDNFSFSKFPKWPDSRKFDRTLRTLRRKKLITGDPKTVFCLTNMGRKQAQDIAKTFRQTKLI